MSYCLLAPPCIESEVRLLNDQVQICHNKVWGYVCTTYSPYHWTDNDASVVCRELGLFHQGYLLAGPECHTDNVGRVVT